MSNRDTIYRQAAIDAIQKRRLEAWDEYKDDQEYRFGYDDSAADTMKILEELPSAQPERKKGKWISLDDFRGKYNDYGYKCSECGEHSDYEENFCPNCGTMMIGGDGGAVD